MVHLYLDAPMLLCSGGSLPHANLVPGALLAVLSVYVQSAQQILQHQRFWDQGLETPVLVLPQRRISG